MRTMTLDELYKKSQSLSEGEVILDVRREDEFNEGHIEGAINISHDEVAYHLDDLKKYSYIYIHCKRGGRAKTAYDALTSEGFENISVLMDGGTDAWIEAGHPLKK